MGGFQGVAAGLASTGEGIGTGVENALNEALKIRAQTFGEQMQSGELALRQAQLKQTYDIAQQQHELGRQQLIQSGWRDLGPTVEGGQYYRTFYNEATKQTSRLPIEGTPPDSPAALLNYYRTVRGMTDDNGKPVFTDLQAKQVAFKMPQLYREGPVGMMEGFRDYAKDSLGYDDVKSQKFAQQQLDLIYGRGAYIRSMFGNYPGQGANMTGWTANEQREYKAYQDEEGRQERMLTAIAERQIAALSSSMLAMDPEALQKKIQEIEQGLMTQLEPFHTATINKQNEISQRHPGAAPSTRISGQPNITIENEPVPAGAPPATNQRDGSRLIINGTPSKWVARGGKWVDSTKTR